VASAEPSPTPNPDALKFTLDITLGSMINRKPKKLVVDLSQVSYIDSSGLAVLIEAMQNVERYGGKFHLAGLQDGVKPIFEIARLDQVFRIFSDADAALAAA
jgi:anti-sigma B factor antagonist